MGVSSIAVQQREKEDEALKSFIVFSLVGSVGLHVAVLSMSNCWVKETKLAEKPIEVIVLDPPKVEAAKPEPKPPPKIGNTSKPSASAKISKPAPEAKSNPKPAIAFSPPKVEKLSSPKTTNIDKPVLKPQPMPIETPKLAKIPPTPIATPTPKVSETLPPVPTPTPVEATPIPTPVASLQSDLIAKLKSTPTPTPTPVVTPLSVSPPKPVQTPVAAKPSPQNNQKPTQVQSPNAAKLQNALANQKQVSDRIPASLGNRAVNNSNAANNFGTPSVTNKLGNSFNGNRERSPDNKIATAPTNTTPAREDLLSPGAGSGGLACRLCPHPAYPKRAERKGLQGTVQLVFDADRNGNVSNVKVANSSGHDILDRAAIEAVKDWKLRSSNSEQQGIVQSFTFAKQGSEIEQEARERQQQQEKERLARERQQQQQERLAREQKQQELLNQMPKQSIQPSIQPTSAPIESDLAPAEP